MSTSEPDIGRNLHDEAVRQAEQHEREAAEPDRIERDIDATRADLRATLSALEKRFSLEHLAEMTIGRIRDRGGEFAGNLTETAARNPMPVLLASIGIGWMMLTSRRGNGSADGARMARKFAAARDRAGDTAEAARESFGDAAESLRSGASRVADAAREQMDHAYEGIDYAHQRFDRLVHEQPLMLGVMGIAAGALIGALLPTTDAEDRLVGEVRDAAVRRAADSNRARYDAAREHARAYSAPLDSGDESERPSRPH